MPALSTECSKPHAHIQQINCNIFPQKDTMIPYMAQPHHPLNNQVLAIFFLSATIPAMPHFSEFTDKYSPPQHSWLLFIVYCFHCIS